MWSCGNFEISNFLLQIYVKNFYLCNWIENETQSIESPDNFIKEIDNYARV